MFYSSVAGLSTPPLITRITPINATIKLTTSSIVIDSFKNKVAKIKVKNGAKFNTIAKVDRAKYLTVMKLTTMVIFPYKVRTKRAILSFLVCRESHIIALIYLFIIAKHITVENILL